MGSYQALLFAAVCISSGIVGYLAIRFLLDCLVVHSLRLFAYYWFGLASIVVVLLILL